MSNTTLTLLLWVKVLILLKNAHFFAKKKDSKIQRVIVLKVIFSETTCACVYLRAKFEVSTVILMGFRQGVILQMPPALHHHHHHKTNP